MDKKPMLPRIIEFKGKKQYIHQWSKELDLPKSTIRNRLAMGWTPERVLAPSTARLHQLTAFGRTQPISHWAKELGVSIELITTRLWRGDSPERALRPKRWTPEQ